MNETPHQAATAARQVQQLSLSFVGPLKRRQKERKELIGWAALLFLQQMKDFQFVEWNELRGKKRNQSNGAERDWLSSIPLH